MWHYTLIVISTMYPDLDICLSDVAESVFIEISIDVFNLLNPGARKFAHYTV